MSVVCLYAELKGKRQMIDYDQTYTICVNETEIDRGLKNIEYHTLHNKKTSQSSVLFCVKNWSNGFYNVNIGASSCYS